MKQLLAVSAVFLTLGSQAQLVVQSGATFFIDAGATVTVQGDVTSNANITGTGKLEMKGTALQNLNMNGFTVPNLKIDNANNVALGGVAKVTGQLEFTNGRLQLGNNNFILGTAGTHTGAGAGKFAETNGTGVFQKEVNAANTYVLPVGNGTDYTPLSYTVAGGAFDGNEVLSARAVAGGHPSKHPRSTDFLNNWWALGNTGFSGSTITATGTYVDPNDVQGVEADLRAMVWNGTAWTRAGASNDGTANTVTAPVTTATNDLYAMNTFVLASPVVILQGAYDASTNRMRDRLRNSSGTYSPNSPGLNNVLPNTDPYRGAPYNTTFVHVNNTVAEQTTSAAVFNDQQDADKNIVDWVFLELRSVTGATTAPVLQTRSALVNRIGQVVDIDGVSPVYFKNVEAGANYAVSVRHRNHIGMSTNPAVPVTLDLAANTVNFTNLPAGSLFGVAGTNYLNANSVNQLYGGNVSGNGFVRYQGNNGPGNTNANDRSVLLLDLSSVETNVLEGYFRGDVNMNRFTRYQGNNGIGVSNSNDRGWLLTQVMGNVETTVKTQLLPGN